MQYIFQEKPINYIKGINEASFEDIALQLFIYQYHNNSIYRDYVNALKINPEHVDSILKVPFLPVSFYKTHEVVSGNIHNDALLFESSSTTSDTPAKHYVIDRKLYEYSLLRGFNEFYGNLENYVIVALLPSYLQRKNASLVYMAQKLMNASGHGENGFYLDEYDQLYELLKTTEQRKQQVLLIGVTFALLDFAEQYPMHLNYTTIMETGGMKGRRKEMIREEVHSYLKLQFGVDAIHSEYGMTELLSQAYAIHDGLFKTSSTMKVLVRDINNPLDVATVGQGCLNVIDLANVHSCAFVATDDIGKVYIDSTFEVLGRADNSVLRGCNLMVV